jgi:hypothetical protein
MKNNLVGRIYTFEDGSTIEVIQAKLKEMNDEPKTVLTYKVKQGNSLPKKLVMEESQFIGLYGHLFGEDNV